MTAPYFHDGSAATLMDVVEHYAKGGEVKTNLSPDLKKLDLTEQDKEDLVAFLHALTSEQKAVVLPTLPVGLVTTVKPAVSGTDDQSLANAD